MDHVDEARALETVVDRLSAQFPFVDRDEIAAIVRTEADKLSDSPVRDHIPSLVEHASKDALRLLAAP